MLNIQTNNLKILSKKNDTTSKKIIIELLCGGAIAKYPRYPFRLRNKKNMPIAKFNENTFYAIKYLLRRRGDSLFVIDKNKARKLRGSTWVKKYYKSIKN